MRGLLSTLLLGPILAVQGGCSHHAAERGAVAACVGAAIVGCVVALHAAGVECVRRPEEAFPIFRCELEGGDFTELELLASTARKDQVASLHLTASGVGSEGLLPDVDKALRPSCGGAPQIYTPSEGSPIYSWWQEAPRSGGAVVRVSQGEAAELFVSFDSDGTAAGDRWLATCARGAFTAGPF